MSYAPFSSKEARENYICEFVSNMVKHSEESTRADRLRWEGNANLFAGIQDFGSEKTDNNALSKVMLHNFSKICREAASVAQDLIFQDPKFFELLPPEYEDLDVFGQITEKILRYRLSQLDLENYTYEYALAGGIYGIAVNKLVLQREVVEKPEVVIEAIEEQEEAESKASAKDIEKKEVFIASNEETLVDNLTAAFDKVFGEGGEQLTKGFKRDIKLKRKIQTKLKLNIVNPVNYFTDPDTSDVKTTWWDGEKSFVKFYELQNLFEAGVLDKKKKKEVAKLTSQSGKGSSFTSTKEGQAVVFRDQSTSQNPYASQIEIIEYHGPLLASGKVDGYEHGEVIDDNCWFIVAGGKVLLKDATNPYWGVKSPYFKSIFSKRPFKAFGAGIADNAVDGEIIANRIFSLYLDHLAFTILGVKGINWDDLAEPTELANGFRPGQVVKLNGGKAAKDSFTDLDYNPNLAFPVLQIIEKLHLSGETAAGVDTSSSNPASRSRISAREVQTNTDKSARSQFSLAREVDSSFIEEVVKRVLGFVLQFDFEIPQLEELKESGVITPSEFQLLQNIPRIERFKELNRDYRVRVKGFRERLQRNDFLARLVECVQQLIQMPAGQDKINWSELITTICEAYRLPADKILFQNSDMDLAREENNLMAGGRNVNILPTDNHQLHLPQHYDQAIRQQSPALMMHIQMHIQAAMQTQGGFPPPPEELQQMLGFAPNGQEQGLPQ